MLREQAKKFHSDSPFTNDVIDAGEKALVLIYNWHTRHKWFCEKVASKTSHLEPQSLPPTSAATRNHSLCVYLPRMEQLQHFIPETGNGKNVKRSSNITIPPASEHLLRVIKCNSASSLAVTTSRIVLLLT